MDALKFEKISEDILQNGDSVVIKHVNGNIYPCSVFTFKTRKPKFKLLDCYYTIYVPFE